MRKDTISILSTLNESILNEKINKDNIEINRAIANPNLGKNKDKIKAAGYDINTDDNGKAYSVKNNKTGKTIYPSDYNKDEKGKVDFKGKLDSNRKNMNKSTRYNHDIRNDKIPKSAKIGKYKGFSQYNQDEIQSYSPSYTDKKSISQNVNDYKDAVKNRDEKSRWAQRSKEGLGYYEDKIKKAQDDLNREKEYINKYEKEAKDSENKRKEILSKVRGKKNESEEMLKEALVPVSELPDMCYGVLPTDASIIIIKKGETGYYLTNKGYEKEYEDIEDWNERNDKADEVANRLNAQIDVTPEQRLSMELRSMNGNWND